MKLTQTVKIEAWILICLNLLMAFGSIWIFMRMTPAIEVIIEQNELISEASDEMLIALLRAKTSDIPEDEVIDSFLYAFDKAKNNITQKHETEIIETISEHYELAFKGVESSINEIVNAINELANINSEAIRRADLRAKQLGKAGAWGIVFMATVTFLFGMILLRSLKKNLLEPIQEIDHVISAVRKGDKMRRCTMKNPTRNIKRIFDNINELLDMNVSYRTDEKQKDNGSSA